MTIITLIAYALPPVALIMVFKFINHRAKHMHCVCPNCGSTFKGSPMTLVFTIRFGLTAFLTCPVCGYKGMMNFINDEE